ncbi:calmin [Anopheles darlingi]|uniref:Calmin n=1 Tax=Anopheles darlingi TaxID=43151 RepID=W5J6I4_ANODA|nr:calmin [Anopheles darlingi]
MDRSKPYDEAPSGSGWQKKDGAASAYFDDAAAKRRKLSQTNSPTTTTAVFDSSSEDDEDSNAAVSLHHYQEQEEDKILAFRATAGTPISPARRTPAPTPTSTPVLPKTPNSPAWYSSYRSQMVHRMIDVKRQFNSSLNEYDIHILEKRDEQERVQKKTFVNWINSFLSKRVPPLRVEDLIHDLKDGTKLLALLEVLSGEKLPMEKGKVLRRPHFLSNINTALQFLTSKRIKLVNINPSDIVDGRPAVVLGLIWTIILYFQIEENSRILHYLNENISGSLSSLGSSSSASNIPSLSSSKPVSYGATSAAVAAAAGSKDMLKQGPRKTLLTWVNSALPKSSGVDVRDFGASWRDGIAFLALIDAIKTNVINIAELKKYNNRYRLDTAFNVAESELGIARLLDAEDVDVNSPDEKSIMTYVAQFLHKYPDVKNINSKSDSERELLDLLDWLRRTVRYYDGMLGKYPNNYAMYENVNGEKLEKQNIYKKVKSINAAKMTPEVQELNSLWSQLERHMQQWLWYLDCNLPDQLGVIGRWLSNGEKLLNDDDIPVSMNEETASLISKKLEAHKQFFGTYYEVMETFNGLKTTPLVKKVPAGQLQNMEKRLLDIDQLARQRRIKLKFLEHKCCLIAFLNLLENKINGVKYSNEETVKQSLDHLKNFVTRNQIMQEFEKALIDMRQVIEEYKIDGNITKKEMYNIDVFLHEIEDRWKNVSSRLICTETMLEDVLSHWQRWRTLVRELEAWLTQARDALQGTEDERIEFFQNVNVYKEKFESLADTYNILKSTCDQETCYALERKYAQLASQWEQIFQLTKQYLHVGDILQHRQKFKADAAQLNQWIQRTEVALARNNLRDSVEIRRCETEIKQIACEIEAMEELFKSVSRCFQALIKEYSRDEVDRMMAMMKQQKESLVRIRAQIPIKLHLFHQLLTQQEALESGQREISQWLDEAENLLISYSFSNDPQQTKNNMAKHKAFFNRTLYYKSMLESKNNVFQNLLKLTDTDKSINMSEPSGKMKQLNDRFQYVINNANDWECKLQENLRVWENFNESKQKVEAFLRQAEGFQKSAIPVEKESDAEAQLEFFNTADQSSINKLEKYTEDLLKYLPPAEQQILIAKVQDIQRQWSEVIQQIPLHLLKVEFRLNELIFNGCVGDIEKELNAEEQAFNCNENFEAILQRNRDFFSKSDLQRVEQVLGNMEKINYIYLEKSANEQSLAPLYQRANDTWVAICKRIDNVRNILHKIPAQWDAYHAKFNEMNAWMDRVDESLRQIMVEKQSMEEFEQEKTTFQNICYEADAKREDMKWLVKTLDFLLSHTNEEQATIEQEKIEKLIARYKTLIPTIETTMIKTEVFAKCYTYRREAQEICDLLDRIKSQAQNVPPPESYKRVNEMIEEQQYSIKELDNQRAHIMKMLQRGKDLSKNPSAPQFIGGEIRRLETGWNDTYNEAAEKLRSLRAVQKVWTDYNEQKGQIVSLLGTAEMELRSVTPLQTDPKSVTHDLDTKRQLALNLKQASSKSLLQLNDLCRELGISLPPTTKQAIEKEVSDLGKRVDNTVDYVEKRVVYLEDYSDKWNEYKQRLDSLKSWANNVYPKMVAAIKQPQITAEERVVKTKQLEGVLTEKIRQLDVLNASAADLAAKEGNLNEMKRLKSEVVHLQSTFTELHRMVDSEKALVSEDFETWNNYNRDMGSIKEWIERAKLAPELEQVRPSTLPEARAYQGRLEAFNEQCEGKMDELQNAIKASQNIRYGVKPSEETDKYYMAVSSVYESAQHLLNKTGKLVNNWALLDTDLEKLNAYIDGAERRMIGEFDNGLKAPQALPIDHLETKIKSLKLFSNEISEQQAKLIALVHMFDQITHSLSEEGVQRGRDQLKQAKDRLAKLSENARAHINASYESIVEQQNFNAQMTDFSNWMDQIRTSISELENTGVDEIELAVQNVQYLVQQHADKRDTFNQIYAQVKQQSLSNNPLENKLLNETYSSLASNYQNLESSLLQMKDFLQKWLEFLQWHNATKDQLSYLRESLIKYDSATEEQLTDANRRVEEIAAGIENWRRLSIAMEQEPCISFHDKARRPVSAITMIAELDNRLASIRSQVDGKLKEVESTKDRVSKFRRTQVELTDTLNGLGERLKAIIEAARLSTLDDGLEDLSTLNEKISELCSAKAQTAYEGNLLLKQDLVPTGLAIQEELGALDGKVNDLQQESDETLRVFSTTSDLYGDFNKYNMSFTNELKQVEALNAATVLNFDNKPALLQALDRLRKASETMTKKVKKSLDMVAAKGNELARLFRGYNPQDCDNILDIFRHNNDLFKANLETLIDNSSLLDQKVALYKQAEQLHEDLDEWLQQKRDQLSRVLEHPGEIESKIVAYRAELPAQQAFKENLDGLLAEFKKLNGGTLPKDLQAMVVELQEGFATIAETADRLNSRLSEYAADERRLKLSIKGIIERIYNIREQIVSCDDMTLDSGKQLIHLAGCRDLRRKLNLVGEEITGLKNEFASMEEKYDQGVKETSTVAKELQNLDQRFGLVMSSLNDVEAKLTKGVEKSFKDKLAALSRMIASQSEKLNWCVPEPTSDKYQLEVKRTTLNDIRSSMDDCERALHETERSLTGPVVDLFSQAKVQHMTDETKEVARQLDQVKATFAATEQQLTDNIALWLSYESISEGVIRFLKDLESRHRMETVLLIDLSTLEAKAAEIRETRTSLDEFKVQMDQLQSVGNKLNEVNQDSRALVLVHHLQNKYQTFGKYFGQLLDRLEDVRAKNGQFRESVDKMRQWLREMNDKKLAQKCLSADGQPMVLTDRDYEAAKALRAEVLAKDGALNETCSLGENLYAEVSVECREGIREEMKRLRGDFNALLDEVNGAIKRIEADLIKKKSIDESHSQLNNWLTELRGKITSGLQDRYATLQEKKSALYSGKNMQKDIAMHETNLDQLQKKIQALPDKSTLDQCEETRSKFGALREELDRKVGQLEQAIKAHEQYNVMLEKSRDALLKLQSQTEEMFGDGDLTRAKIEENLIHIENVLAEEEAALEGINDCYNQFAIVMTQTHENGHSELLRAFEDNKRQWTSFFEKCRSFKMRSSASLKQLDAFNARLDGALSWLAGKRNEIKETATQPQCLPSLQKIRDAVQGYGVTVSGILEEGHQVKSKFDVTSKVAQLQNEYRTVAAICADAITKAESTLHDQSDFNQAYEDFEQLLRKNLEGLQEFNQLVGDLSVLQERQLRLKEIAYKRLDDSSLYEDLINRGEKLYSFTSPEGREVIRQKLGAMRDLWDRFSDELNAVTHQLDQCILQFGEFSLQQEQLSKWLKDIESSMKSNAELKANIQDKRTQYQNHKLMHQEILSQAGLVESVCAKAQQLLSLTKDQHLQSYVVSIKDTYQGIVRKSGELLDNLNNCVAAHQNYVAAGSKLRSWINEEKDKVLCCEEMGGEKTEINKRIEALNNLKLAKPKGDELLNTLVQCYEQTKASTSAAGVGAIEREIGEMRSELTSLYTQIDELIGNQRKSLSGWGAFDQDLEGLTKWCRSMEAIFREQQLYDSLERKQQQLEVFRANQEQIGEKQKQIDDFVTTAQALFTKTGVEKIKFYINQLINRYQLLQVLSKEVANRAQNIVNDHRSYEERFGECANRLGELEKELEMLGREKLATAHQSRLQHLEMEKEKFENNLTSLVTASEKVLPETNAQGREKIREDVRQLRERWDQVIAALNNAKKQLDVRSIQWSSYQDVMQQVLAWLDATERKIEPNESQSWNSTQEIRSKLFKYKAILQEISGHRRIIDSLKEKADSLATDEQNEDITAKVHSINERYELLKKSCVDLIRRLEQSLELCNKFNDAQKSLLDEQDHLFSELKQLSDVSGNKRAVQEKIQKIDDLHQQQAKMKEKFNHLAKLITDNGDLISYGAKTVMEQDRLKMAADFEKFVVSIGDARVELEKRLQLWDDYQRDLDQIGAFLGEVEDTMRGYTLKSSLGEKQEQHEYYQALLGRLKQNALEFDKLLDKSSELLQSSGDSKISFNMQQLKARAQSVEGTVKELAKKCEQAYTEHKQYRKRYADTEKELDDIREVFDSCRMDSAAGAGAMQQDPQALLGTIHTLLAKQNLATVQCNAVSDIGEQLYASTATKGQQMIRNEIQELVAKCERLFDEINAYSRSCEGRLAKFTGFMEKADQLQDWLNTVEQQLGRGNIILKPTLDEKCAQQQAYTELLNDIKNHKPELNNLRDLVDDNDAAMVRKMDELSGRYEDYLEKAQSYGDQYNRIVDNHRQYCKAVMETQDFIDANHNTVELWGETDLDQVSLLTNRDRLSELKRSIVAEQNRVEQIRLLGEATVPDTSDEGQANIRSQIDISQQEWEGLLAAIDSTLDSIGGKMGEWTDYEKIRTDCMNWMRDIDAKVHSVDLKATLIDKKATLDYLKSLQGEVKAKELEIDNFTEKAQQLYRGYLSSRNSQISELAVKYQQTSSRVKELVGRWQQYVIQHQELETRIGEHRDWLNAVREKLNYCADMSSTSEKELQSKLKLVQDMIVNKEDGSGRLQVIVDLAQQVLACTTPSGHEAVNKAVAALQDEWSALALRMIDIRTQLDEAINQWSGFLDQVNDLKRNIDWMENELAGFVEFQATMADKRAQLERIKNTEEKIRLEKIEIEPLKQKTAEMTASGQQSQAATTAQQILGKFDYLAEKISKILTDREDQYRDHRLYKEAYDDLFNWISRAREKLPCVKQQSLSDKLTMDSAIAPLDALMNKRAQGELLVEHLVHTGEVVMASTSERGKEAIRSDINGLKANFDSLFGDIDKQKRDLEKTLNLLREYKEEYERLSEWLQQVDILVKNHKLATCSTLEEKEKQVREMRELIGKLEKGQAEMDKFNAFAAPLLQSHLDTYIGNQLRHLNSRYQVQVNLAKDVLKKVETNADLHREYKDNLTKANGWIDNAKEIVRYSTENVDHVSKENLEKRLAKIVELIQQREQGQHLVNATVNTGEKVVKSTKSDGKEVINGEIKDIQTNWDRLVKRMSTAKVQLETNLLQWADYSSSYNHLQQWIQDRESKLQQVCEQKVVRFRLGGPSSSLSSGLNERRANLRQANDIVQDIVSFEPMIQSVASKASDLRQTSPASEISNKYETLSKHAKQMFEKQKETVELHQAFIDASNEFAAWIRNAKECLNKCSDSRGDKETLVSKMTQLKILDNDVPVGQKKLEKALEQAEVACRSVESEEVEAIEKEVAILQEEFDNYCLALKKISGALENGIVRWTEYDDQYGVALKWLDGIEQEVQTYNKMQANLQEKKRVLEEFQDKLQTLFDWQRELDSLNMRAQVLLDICADTRISNGVTQLTTKYNVLLSIAKEIMRRLELHYQEHQQHNTLYGECQDWLDRMREKLNECEAVPHTLAETQSKLNIVKGIRQSLEQGQNKLRYLIELKEKIVLSTETSGASKIEEDTENLKTEYESLMVDITETRQRLTNHLAQLEDVGKLSRMLAEWIEEVQGKLDAGQAMQGELADKRVLLEKYRAIHRETGNYNDVVEKTKAKLTENPNMDGEEVSKILSDYETVVARVAAEIERLENQVNNHERFKQALAELYDWMKTTRQAIQQSSDFHGDKEHIVGRIEKLKAIELSFDDGKLLLENAADLGNTLASISGQEGQDTIRQEMQQARTDWDELETLTRTTRQTLNECLSSWDSFLEQSEHLNSFLEEYNEKVNGLGASEGTAEQAAVLSELKHIQDLILTKKSTVEELNDVCEALMEKSACSTVRDRTVDLQKSFSTLLGKVQGFITKLEKNLVSHTEFLYYKDEITKWLNDANVTIKNCNDVAADDVLIIRQKVIQLQGLSNAIPQGQKLFEMLQDSFTKSSYLYPEEKQTTMFQDISDIRDSLDTVIIGISSSLNNLNAQASRLESYEEMKRRIAEWLDTTEAVFETIPETHGEMTEVKTLLERLKHIQTEISFKHSDLENLQQEASNLFDANKCSTEMERVANLQSRCGKLSERCTYHIRNLEMELEDQISYYQNLQEIEKWLLQISFQLMAHNSLYIYNREQTLEQIAQHEKLLDEIQRYQVNIDDFNAKGQSQIERYILKAPAIKSRIETQMKNIRDSYNSLLNTSVQIKNRLHDSLNKFQEYEDTLDDINRQLDELEPQVAEERQIEVTDYENGQRQLEKAQGIHNKLLVEKSRLMFAVQACEAATASISRPSSPMDNVSQMIPEKELMVRARLEDLIDDVQQWIGDLVTAINDCERQHKQKVELENWIQKQKLAVADWSSKPSKFRPDAAEQELRAMGELSRTITVKRDDLQGETDQDYRLREELEKLQTDLKKVIDRKKDDQLAIEKYRKNYEDVQSWLDAITNQIDNVEKGSGLNCRQKLEKISNIKRILEDDSEMIPNFRRNGEHILQLVSNLDAQQVTEQLKSIDRRHKDITSRLNRRLDVIDSTNKMFGKLKSDIGDLSQWVVDKNESLNVPYQLGSDTKSAENQQQAFKTLMKEYEGKQAYLDTLGKRYASIQGDLEPNEKQQLEVELQKLSKSLAQLGDRVRGELDKIVEDILCRKNMHNNLDVTRAWIRTKQNDINKISDQIPLLSNNVNSEIKLCRRHAQTIREFEENAFRDVSKQVREIMKDCSDEGKAKLAQEFGEIEAKLRELVESCSRKIEFMEREHGKRREFEERKDRVWNWLNEAESIVSADIRTTSYEILKEQKQKFDKLYGECETMKGVVKEADDFKSAIVPTLNELDKTNINNQVKVMREKWNGITNVLKVKCKKLEDHLAEYEDALAKIESCAAFIARVQSRLKEMNRPVTSKIENIQDFLLAYEQILGSLKDKRLEMSTILLTNLPQLRENSSKLEEMIMSIEEQLRRLKAMLLLKEQFIGAINDIVKQIAKINTDFNTVDNFTPTVEDRLLRYGEILQNIESCEGLLVAATDKGHQIASEGTDLDRHNIMDQIHSLQEQLQSIKRSIELEQDKYQKQRAYHKTLSNDLFALVDWFKDNDEQMRSRPLFGLDLKAADQLHNAHVALAGKANINLKMIDDLLSKLKHTDSKLPEDLQTMVDRARTLQATVPEELVAREAYLVQNRQYRLEFRDSLERIKKWLEAAEERFQQTKTFSFDQDKITVALKELEDFMHGEVEMRNLLFSGVQEQADRLWNSLSELDQNQCLGELQQLKNRLSDVSHRAAVQQTELLSNSDLVKSYKKHLSAVKNVLVKSKLDDTILTIPTLSSRIDHINILLNMLQVSLIDDN